MNIVIDTSVIGLGQLFETARTGIYRVISSLAMELLRRDDLDIRYCSLSSIEVATLNDTFFRNVGYEGKSFSRNTLESSLISWAAQVEGSERTKILEKILSRLYRMSQKSRIGKETNIFHSMYSALPRFSSSTQPLRTMTIYDIIPLIHPEYFADGFADEFRPIVESFSPQRDFVFTISESTKTDICSYFNMEPERIFVTPLAASTQLYHPVSDEKVIDDVKKQFHIPDGRYFLTLATVEKRKNLEASIRSFRAVLDEPGCEDLYFVLVGTRGWKVHELIEEIDNDPLLRQKVIFTGFIPDQYLSAIYSGAEGFLYPSLYEGFGLPPLEAMQCGLPVITSNSSSLPEVVGDAGILVAPHDTEQIASAMLSLLQDRTLRDKYVRKGLARAAEFSWKYCADQTVAGYRKAWDGR